jgi:hypothetical protein
MSSRSKAVIVFAWWFISIGMTSRVSTALGPFANQAQCQQVREWADKYAYAVSWCWYDGR